MYGWNYFNEGGRIIRMNIVENYIYKKKIEGQYHPIHIGLIYLRCKILAIWRKLFKRITR